MELRASRDSGGVGDRGLPLSRKRDDGNGCLRRCSPREFLGRVYARGWTSGVRGDLGGRCGVTRSFSGSAAITPQTAQEIAAALGNLPAFGTWNGLPPVPRRTGPERSPARRGCASGFFPAQMIRRRGSRLGDGGAGAAGERFSAWMCWTRRCAPGRRERRAGPAVLTSPSRRVCRWSRSRPRWSVRVFRRGSRTLPLLRRSVGPSVRLEVGRPPVRRPLRGVSRRMQGDGVCSAGERTPPVIGMSLRFYRIDYLVRSRHESETCAGVGVGGRDLDPVPRGADARRRRRGARRERSRADSAPFRPPDDSRASPGRFRSSDRGVRAQVECTGERVGEMRSAYGRHIVCAAPVKVRRHPTRARPPTSKPLPPDV